ncbi:ABC transporter permease [Chelatococcus sp. SYSU_G07232]|uniref:ABC transporter permease n=1 Tax=Chelatococcus albus TaxID=3047466 RepID=A0ABT7ACJ4_9HYPH|nr:ABC transporter permease [Chelatococcus sp. SYSU_G07232]MDJ1157058.1 ABC transporter permease [Chelatococcus sp. SYSU_G07232]
MLLRIEPRPEVSRPFTCATPAIAMLLTVASGWLLFLALGLAPGETLYQFLVSPLLTLNGLAELGVKAAPLVLIGVGLAIGFRANVWNIGAEGQLTIGAIAAGWVALAFWGQEGLWILPAMCVAGMLGGLAYAAIPAFLKTRFDVNEILTSLMLTYVANLVLSVLVFGPWKDPDGFNFPQTKLFSESAILPILVEGTRLHLGALVALGVAVAAWLLLSRTVVGFQIEVVGQAPAAARFAGFSGKRTVWLTMLLGGALAGLAGTFEAAGPIGQLIPKLTPGYGFTAIIVAFLGRLHPLGIVVAALVMALSYIGGENAQVTASLPQAATGVFQGMLLFYLLASDFLVRYRVRLLAAERKLVTAS